MGKRAIRKAVKPVVSKRHYFDIGTEELDGYNFPAPVLDRYITCKRLLMTGLKQASFLEFVGGKCMFVDATRREKDEAKEFVKKILTGIGFLAHDEPASKKDEA